MAAIRNNPQKRCLSDDESHVGLCLQSLVSLLGSFLRSDVRPSLVGACVDDSQSWQLPARGRRGWLSGAVSLLYQ